MQRFVSGREVFIGHELPVKVQRINPPPPFGEEKLVLSKMLSEGDLHGAVVPGDTGYPGLFGGGETPPMMSAYPGVKPLFDNDGNHRLHYKDRHQSNHACAFDPPRNRRALSRLPRKLTRAFMEARDIATQYMDAEEISGYAKERDVLGEDPYAYVMGENENARWQRSTATRSSKA